MAQENIVICSCGQWNRITAQAKRVRFLCGKCGRRLEVSDRAARPGRRRTRWGMLAIAFLGITTIIVANNLTNRISPGLNFRNAKPVQVSPVSTSALPQPELGQSAPAPQARQPELAPVPVQNSVLRRRKGQSAVAGLKVTTPSSADYVLKLINTRDGKEEVMIYVRSNSSFETKVPLGTYKIIGASGTQWYGEAHLFGEATSYFRLADSRGTNEFPFQRTANRIVGYHFHLTQQLDGTLQTQSLSAEEFRR